MDGPSDPLPESSFAVAAVAGLQSPVRSDSTIAPTTAQSNPRLGRLAATLVLFLCHQMALHADSLVARDGTRHEGTIAFTGNNQIQITGTNTVTTLPLSELLHIRITPLVADTTEPTVATLLSNRFANRFVAVPQSGVLTWNGSFIAARLRSLDDTRLTLHGSNDGVNLTRLNTTAIFFQPLSLHHAHLLRHVGPGVLLRNGDFVEGRIRAVQDGRVTLSSLLFGPRTYRTDREAVALWLQDPVPKPTRYSVQTATGSHFLLPEFEVRQNAIVLNSSPFQNYLIPLDQELEVNCQQGTNLLALAWARLDNASPTERESLLSRIEIPDLEKEAAEANLVRARNIWDDARRVRTNKSRDYDRAKADTARAKAQAEARRAEMEAARNALELAGREFETRKQRALLAAEQLEEAQRVIPRSNDEPAKTLAEQRVHNATRIRDTANRTMSRARVRLAQATTQHQEAIAASEEAVKTAERLAETEAVALKELERAERETDAAKQAFDLAMTRLL